MSDDAKKRESEQPKQDKQQQTRRGVTVVGQRPAAAPRASVPPLRGFIGSRPIGMASPAQRSKRRQSRSAKNLQPSGRLTVLRNEASSAELMIYGTIGADWFGEGITGATFDESLKSLGDVKTIRLRINSGGGDVFEATAIYNQLIKHGAKIIVEVEGVAASAATLIAMAAAPGELHICENAHWMVHAASGVAFGNAEQIRQYLKLLDNADRLIRLTYRRRTGLSDSKLAELMAVDNWMTADEAKEYGFVDSIDSPSDEDPHVKPEDSARPKQPVSLTKERIAAAIGHLNTLAASVSPAKSSSKKTGDGPQTVSQTEKDRPMRKLTAKQRAQCVKLGMPKNATQEEALRWFDANIAFFRDMLATEEEATDEEGEEETMDPADEIEEDPQDDEQQTEEGEEHLTSEMDEEDPDAEENEEEKPTQSFRRRKPANRTGRNGRRNVVEDVLNVIEQRERAKAQAQRRWRSNIDAKIELAFGDNAPEGLRERCYAMQDAGEASVRKVILAAKKRYQDQVGNVGRAVVNFSRSQPRDRHIAAIKAGVLARSLGNFRATAPRLQKMPDGRWDYVVLSGEQLLDKHLPQKNRPEGWQDFSQLPLIKIAEECLLADGISYEQLRRLPAPQIAMAAMGHYRQAGIRADGALHTTGSLLEITRDAINKSLLAGYEEAPQTWREVGRQGASVADFKDIHRVKLSAAQNLPVWPDNTAPEQAKLSNEKEKYAVEARAETLTFSWRLVVNDDMDALSRRPQLLGDAAARTVNAEFWRQITSNPTMADSVALFSAATGNRKQDNLITGSATPTNSTIGSMRKLMRLMRGLNTPEGNQSEDVLNLIPAYIVGPAALEEAILKQVFSGADPASGGNSAVFNTARTLTPVIEPLLDAASATAWYLFASPSRIDTVELTFLQGQETPLNHEWIDDQTMSQNFTIIQTFAAKAIEWRSIIKHAGA